VIAANFTSSWTPTFQISGLGNGQTAFLEWSYSRNFATIVGSGAIVNGTPLTTAAATVASSVTNTSTGVSIYVRIRISNNTFEGTALTTVVLAVDGQNSVNDWDIDNGNGTLCVETTAADQKDTATQTLDPRPTVTPTTPTPFVPGNQTN
jgi:hypothetical protein